MPPLFTDPERMAFAAVAIAFAAVRAKYTVMQRDAQARLASDSPADRLLVLGIIPFGTIVIPAIWVLSTLLDFADYSRPVWVGLLGFSIMSIGTILFWRSHVELGRNFSGVLQVMEGARLVTTGLYSRVRHPMYAAIAIYAIGQMLLIPNWIAGPSNTVVAVFIYCIRVPREEALLEQAFGDQFNRYKTATGMVLPRLRRAHLLSTRK